jgi:hypothetical protein
LIHHSDRGVQYRAIRYTDRLADAEAVASVGSKGDSYDNALAEAFNSLFKAELIRNKGPWRGINELGIALATIYRGRKQPRADAGEISGVNSAVARFDKGGPDTDRNFFRRQAQVTIAGSAVELGEFVLVCFETGSQSLEGLHDLVHYAWVKKGVRTGWSIYFFSSLSSFINEIEAPAISRDVANSPK